MLDALVLLLVSFLLHPQQHEHEQQLQHQQWWSRLLWDWHWWDYYYCQHQHWREHCQCHCQQHGGGQDCFNNGYIWSGCNNNGYAWYIPKTLLTIFYHRCSLNLWPGSWEEQLGKLNNHIQETNEEKKWHGRFPSRYQVIKEVSPSEFWIFWGLIIAARVYGKQGDVWMRSDPEGIEPVVDFTKNMTKARHITIKRFMYRLFADESLKDTDPWWVISPAIKLFNDRRQTHVWASYLKVFDESMSAYTPQSTKTGNLPHLSCILRKPEPLAEGTVRVTNDNGWRC